MDFFKLGKLLVKRADGLDPNAVPPKMPTWLPRQPISLVARSGPKSGGPAHMGPNAGPFDSWFNPQIHDGPGMHHILHPIDDRAARWWQAGPTPTGQPVKPKAPWIAPAPD